MERHPEYEYCIKEVKGISKEAWVFISDNGSGWEDEIFDWTNDEQYLGPIELIKRIEEEENWTIEQAGELQYSFEEDSNHIVFQMDDLYGFAILIKDMKKYDDAMEFIKKYVQ